MQNSLNTSNQETGYSVEKISNTSNPSFVKNMVQLFIKMSKEYITSIAQASQEEDIMKINQLAHWIKPSIDIMSIESIRQTIREIEASSQFNDELKTKISFTINRLQFVTSNMEQVYA